MRIMSSHAEEVLRESLIGLHLLEVEHERAEVLESGHFNPFVRVFAKLVK